MILATAPPAEARDKSPAGTKATGEIVSVGADKIVIRGNEGIEAEFVINANTKYGKDKALAVGDFGKGDKVLIVYMEENGRRVARSVVAVGALHEKALKGAKSPGDLQKRDR